MAVEPVPEGYNPVTPSLIVEDAAGMLEFIKAAFVERCSSGGQDGRQGLALVNHDATRVMVDEGGPDHHAVLNASLYL